MRHVVLACVVLAAAGAPAKADRIAPIAQPAERALRVPVVVVGKVVSVEKDPVDAPLYPGAATKVPHRIAVVKVETNLAGADSVTHLRVGFVPAGAGGRRGPDNPDLKEGQEWLFFVVRHHGGEFYAIPYLTPPVESKADNFKAQLDSVKKTLAVVADPAKALKAEKAADRFAAAVAIVHRYRMPLDAPGALDSVALTADESRVILKALAEGKWEFARGGDSGLNGYTAFAALGLTDKDGWKPPVAEAGKDYLEQTREAFVRWLEGPGKDYQIKKLVPKTPKK